MEGAFTHLGNHLISDSASTINAGAGDDLSSIDPHESLLDREYGRDNLHGIPRRAARTAEATADPAATRGPIEGPAAIGESGGTTVAQPEEEKELPPHACSYVVSILLLCVEAQTMRREKCENVRRSCICMAGTRKRGGQYM